MRLTNIGDFKNIDDAIRYKLSLFDDKPKDFEHIFENMFTGMDYNNIISEKTDGYRIIKTTYGQCKEAAVRIASGLSNVLSEYPKQSIVGMYMANSIEWIEIFWALLMSGYTPLLMNSRLDDATLEKVITEHGIAAVISDDKKFSVRTFVASDIAALEAVEGVKSCWSDEIIIMSSGTSENIKLCVYTGEKFYYQLCNTAVIVKESKEIKSHYEGELKLLTFLPFYHIFGLAAVFMWFGFFSRTFVFLNDFGADTILNTVRKHKVTHIFAVPLLWNKIYEAAIKKIHDRGEKTFNKFQTGLKLAEKLDFNPAIAKAFSKKAFKEVRDNLFGDSIQFLIAGGSYISPEVVRFFNGIGYHLAVGFGMSEVGITSVEISDKARIRNTCSVGKPFMSVEYSVGEDGELLIRGNCTAARIIQGDTVTELSADKWFHTKDMVKHENGRYYVVGRKDDMIPCKNGENLNPNRIEGMLDIKGARAVCLIAKRNEFEAVTPVLVIEVSKYLSNTAAAGIIENVRAQLVENKLDGTINEIVLTTDTLMGANDFKLNRHRISRLYSENKLSVVVPDMSGEADESISDNLLNELRNIFADALSIEADSIEADAHFFYDLNGTSLDYLSMLADIQKRYEISLTSDDEASLVTVRAFGKYIQENLY